MNIDRSSNRKAVLSKAAGLVEDVAATIPTSAASRIPVLGAPIALAGLSGSVAGLISKPKSNENPDADAKSIIPGVAQYRLRQRTRRSMDASNRAGKRGTANVIAELLGSNTSSLISGGIGAAIGSILSRKASRDGRILGTAGGAAAGVALPLVGGAIAAAIRRKRTKEEQIANDTTGRAVAKYIVPGLAAYDDWKRLGSSTHYDETDKDAKAKKSAEVKRAFSFDMSKLKDTLIGSASAPYQPGVISKLLANEHLRRAALGSIVSGTTAALTSDKKNRFRNTLLSALAGGAGTYAASSTGVMDNLLSPIRRDINGHMRSFVRDQTAREITRSMRGPDKGSMQERVRSILERAPQGEFSLTTRWN